MNNSTVIDRCPICEGGIQSHVVVTQEFEGVTIRITDDGKSLLEDEGQMVYEDYFGAYSGTEIYCENDHTEDEMVEEFMSKRDNNE